MATIVSTAKTTTRKVQALRFYDKGDIRIEQVPVAPCGRDEVRLKVAYSGICGTDIHELLGGPIFPPSKGEIHPLSGALLPVTLGHEFSGTVIEAGDKVKRLQVGQDVAVNPALDHRHWGLDLCSMCSISRYNLCNSTTTYGLSAPGGGFCEEIVVKELNCVALPPNVSLKAAALAEPLSVAHHCVATSGFKAGQTALICGAGPIGLAISLILRVIGASKIIVTEVTGSRIAQARKFGADAVLNPMQMSEAIDGSTHGNSTLSSIYNLTGVGVDVAFDATGLQSTLDLCIHSTKPGGIVFNVAIHEKPLSINLNDLSRKERKLMAGIGFTDKDFEAVIQMLADGKIDAEQMVTSVVPLSDAVQGGFGELINNKASHVKILIKP